MPKNVMQGKKQGFATKPAPKVKTPVKKMTGGIKGGIKSGKY